MNRVKKFTLLIFLSIFQAHAFNYPLLSDYLQWKNLRVILFVDCDRTYRPDFNRNINYFKSSNIWINYYDISSETDLSGLKFEQFFVRTDYQYVVVVNSECNYTENIFEEISSRKMFHFDRSWLIFGGTTEKILQVIIKQNINVDADIAMAVPIDERLLYVLIITNVLTNYMVHNFREYQISDVYNPNQQRNGKFKMESVGIWSRMWGLKMNETLTKFEKRRDFGGVTFLSVITVIFQITNFLGLFIKV